MLVARDERTHDEIIAGFNECARTHREDATLSPRTFRRWLSGDVQTQPRPTQRRVARLYWGFPMGQLLEPAPPELLAPGGDRPATSDPVLDRLAISPAPAPAPAPAPPPVSSDADGDFFDPQFSVERQMSMATRRAARFTALAESQNIGAETVGQLRDQVGELARAYVRDPLITIVGELVETQDTIFTLLEGKQKPGHARDLYLLAGIVSGLLAKTSQDLGHAHEAMTQARTVYVCADNADHQGLRAFARAMQSLIAYWAGRPQEAVRYAEAGAQFARELTGSLTAWLPALEARAWAQLSDAEQTLRAIGRAESARELVQPDDLDAVGGLLTFPVAKQHYYAAGSFVYLDGESARGQREASSALDLYERGNSEDRSFSDEAGARAELAIARVLDGEIDGAYDAITPVLDLPPERRIGGIVTSAMRVHAALRSPRFANSAVARDARDEIEGFTRRPVAALPR